MKHATVAGLAVMTLVASCAGNERQQVSNNFATAEASIEQAERAGAQRYSGRELNLARQQLDQAKAAQEEGDAELAQRLAAQAEVDAQLAAAIAGNEEMQMAVQELRSSLQTLRDEIARGQQ